MGSDIPTDIQIAIVPYLVYRVTQIVLLGVFYTSRIIEVVPRVGAGNGDATDLLPWRSLRNTNRGPRLICFTVLRFKRRRIIPNIFRNPPIYVVGIVIGNIPGVALPTVVTLDMPENVVGGKFCVLGIAGSRQMLSGPCVQVHPVKHVVIALRARLGVTAGGVKREGHSG